MPDQWITIRPGDSVENVAHAHGHFWRSVWRHLENEHLRAQRESPHHLVPGDQLFVPELRPGSADCSTQQRHVFRRKGVPSFLRLVLCAHGSPRRNVPYLLTIDGKFVRGQSDQKGVICEPIPPDAQSAQLCIGDPPFQQRLELKLRALEPVSTSEGVRARLRNLGYSAQSEGDTPEELETSIRRFQVEHKLKVDGRLDDNLRDRIKQQYGS